MPGGIFNIISDVTTGGIDNFIFGGRQPGPVKDVNGILAKYVFPNDTANELDGLGEGDADVAEENNNILLSTYTSDDFTTVAPGGDKNENVDTRPSHNSKIGKAYGEMEQAAIGSGKKSRTDVLGGRSFINPYAIIHHAACNTANDFFDIEGREGAYPKKKGGENRRDLTLEGLLEDFPTVGSKPERFSTPYRIGDFLYCKYYGRVPLNHMITLRRFAHPTYDNLTWGSYNNEDGTTASRGTNNALPSSSGYNKGGKYNYKPIAQAVTFWGESTGNDLEKITAIKGEIKWKQLEADVNKYEANDSNGVRGAESTPFGGVGFKGLNVATLAKGVSILNGGGDLGRNKQVDDGNRINLFEAHWANKTYGPVDSITQTQIRDRGVHATHKVELVFEYELRSYAGINPRIAMLDIIANMLALTFNNARFWGGANIFFPNHPQFAFLGNQKDYYNGDYGKYIGTVFDSLGGAMGKGLDILKSLASSIMNLDFKGAASQIAKSLGGSIMDMQAAKSRPATMAIKSLLSGQPNGCWHLTVGNPYRPIMKMGNMIVKEWEMSFSGFVGIDDFPSEMKYKITLETCRPVDKGGVESWLNGISDSRSDGLGSGRLYYPSAKMLQGISDKYKDFLVTSKVDDAKNGIQAGDVTSVNSDSLLKKYSEKEFSKDLTDFDHMGQSAGSLF